LYNAKRTIFALTWRGRGRDRTVVEFTTTYATSAYHR